MPKVSLRKADVDGFNVFYREAGSKEAPVILRLRGFPSLRHMFRDLFPLLADRFHLVDPSPLSAPFCFGPVDLKYRYLSVFPLPAVSPSALIGRPGHPARHFPHTSWRAGILNGVRLQMQEGGACKARSRGNLVPV
jgi:hypothetical protein